MRPKVVLFGDSITEESFSVGGWGARLADHLARKADVVIRGFSGYNTRWALMVMDKALDGISGGCCSKGTSAASPVAAVTVFFGANDAAVPDLSCGFRSVPIPEYKSNLRTIVSKLKERWPDAVVLLITPPPVDEDGRVRHPYAKTPAVNAGLPDRTNERTGEYAKACVGLAQEDGIPVVDLWSKMQRHDGWQKQLLSDGLHLTREGNDKVFREVVAALRDQGLSHDTIPTDLPDFTEIHEYDPLKAFRDL